MNNKHHINYIDGLKGLCVVLIVVLHYVMGYVVNSGYVGWESGIDFPSKIDYFWDKAPISFVANLTFILRIFFTIIAFLPAWHFFNKGDEQWIKKQAIVRYFRFVPYVFTITLISYAIYVNGGFFNIELGALLNLKWSTALLAGDFSWADAVYSGLFRSFLQGDDDYVYVFWCMHIIFLGSYLAYTLLLLFASFKKHLYIYGVMLLMACFVLPWAVSFIGGIMLASIASSEFKNPSSKSIKNILGWIFFSLGLFCGMCASGITINMHYLQLIEIFSALSLFLGIIYLEVLQKSFSAKWMLACGKYVFSIIIVHPIVMLSISAWMFIELHAVMGYAAALGITFFTAIFLNAFFAVLFAKIIDPICAYCSKLAFNLLK